MWHDVLTVFWKEMTVLRRAYRKPSSFISTSMYVVFFGVFPAFFLGVDFVTSPLTLFYLTIAPLVTGSGMATLAFAGERENHTLETLFASRLGDLPILLGKVAANTVYAWMQVPLCMAAGWLIASVLAGQILPYRAVIFVGVVVIGLVMALFSASIGALASLRAGTMKAAGRKLQWIYVVFMLPYFVLNLMPETTRAGLVANLTGADIWLIVAGAVSVLFVVDVGMMFVAMRQFKRSQMLLD